MSTIELSPHQFMAAVFPQYLLTHTEVPLIAHPVTYYKDGEQRSCYRQYPWSPRSGLLKESAGWTFSISTVYPQNPIRRRLDDLKRCFVIPCDDIGTKAVEPTVSPSYVLETSPGNFQWGYLIDPYPVEDYAGAAQIDAFLLSLAEAGFNDAGCRGASRVVKLPGALHKSGFITRVVHWEPECVFGLEELVRLMDIPMIEPRMGKRRRPTNKPIEDINDPILDWLVETQRVAAVNDRGFAELTECPWADAHSKTRTGGDYSPMDYGMPGIDFKCLHESCRDRTVLDFVRWVKEQGGPVPAFYGGDA